MESKAYNSYVILQFGRRVNPTTPTLFYSQLSTESKAYNSPTLFYSFDGE